MLLQEINKISRNKRFVVISIIVVLIAGFFWVQSRYTALSEKAGGDVVLGDFAKEVEKCNSVEKQLRFSCYRSVLEKYYEGDLKKFLQNIESDAALTFKSNDASYAIFGTNGHTFYHAVGDFIGTNHTGSNVKSALSYCSQAHTNGCMMGLYKRTALKNGFPTDLLREFYQICREGEKHQCAHEIGHLLHDKYTSSILETLDRLSYEQYDFEYPKKYTYALFENPNLNAPFEECRQIVPEDERSYCYTGVGHNLFLFSEFSSDGYKSQFQECMNIEEGNREDCFGFLLFRIGINSAASKFLSSQFEQGNKICKDAVAIIGRDDLMYHCYKGVGGGIGLFVESEYPEYFRETELPIFSEEFTLADIQSMKRVLLDFATLCEASPVRSVASNGASPEKFATECFQGLLGTRFKTLYLLFGVKHEKIEELLPNLDNFEVSG